MLGRIGLSRWQAAVITALVCLLVAGVILPSCLNTQAGQQQTTTPPSAEASAAKEVTLTNTPSLPALMPGSHSPQGLKLSVDNPDGHEFDQAVVIINGPTTSGPWHYYVKVLGKDPEIEMGPRPQSPYWQVFMASHQEVLARISKKLTDANMQADISIACEHEQAAGDAGISVIIPQDWPSWLFVCAGLEDNLPRLALLNKSMVPITLGQTALTSTSAQTILPLQHGRMTTLLDVGERFQVKLSTDLSDQAVVRLWAAEWAVGNLRYLLGLPSDLQFVKTHEQGRERITALLADKSCHAAATKGYSELYETCLRPHFSAGEKEILEYLLGKGRFKPFMDTLPKPSAQTYELILTRN